MLNRTEYYLNLIQEECSEVAQRASKSIRFGLDELKEGRMKDNKTLLCEEYLDLMTIFELLDDELGGELTRTIENINQENWIEEKKIKVKKWLKYSQSKGCAE